MESEINENIKYEREGRERKKNMNKRDIKIEETTHNR